MQYACTQFPKLFWYLWIRLVYKNARTIQKCAFLTMQSNQFSAVQRSECAVQDANCAVQKRKIVKIVVTRCEIVRLNVPIWFWLGSVPVPSGLEELTVLPGPLAHLRGLYLGREGREEKRGKGRNGREREEAAWGRLCSSRNSLEYSLARTLVTALTEHN